MRAMKLSEWLDLPNPDGTRKNRAKFAHDIGVTPQMISAYCKGDHWPSKARMREIAEKTGGAVTANDFLDSEAAQ